MTLNELAASMLILRDQLTELEAEEKKVRDKLAELKESMLARMDAEELNSVTCNLGRITRTTRTVVSIPSEKFQDFWKFAKEHDAFYLFQRRPAILACLEAEKVLGCAIPGTEKVMISDVSFTRKK